MEKSFSYPAHWNEKYSICFLYYLVADADFIIKEEELKVIERKLDVLFANRYGSDTKAISEEVMVFVKSLTNEQKTETVKILSQKYRFSHDAYLKIIKDLEEIALADGYVSIEEHSMMFYLRLHLKKNYERAEATNYVTESQGIKTRRVGIPMPKQLSNAFGLIQAFM